MRMRIAYSAAIISSLCTFMAFNNTSNAATIFSDFGPGNSFKNFTGWTVSTASSSVGQLFSPAMGFSSAIDADVTQIDIVIQNNGGSNAGTKLGLYTNVGNDLGSLLASWTLGSVPAFNTNGFDTISGITGVHLSAGGSYFLLAEAAGDDANIWDFNSIGVSGPSIVAGFFDTRSLGTFDVIGTPTVTPIPAALPLFATGAGLIALLARRKRIGSSRFGRKRT